MYFRYCSKVLLVIIHSDISRYLPLLPLAFTFYLWSRSTAGLQHVQKIAEDLQSSLQICSCPYVTVARSLQILKENRLTDLHDAQRKLNMGLHMIFKVASNF